MLLSHTNKRHLQENLLTHNLPTNGPQLWPLDGLVVNPPVMRRIIGRPKKMQNNVNGEAINPRVLPRMLTTVVCHKCTEPWDTIREAAREKWLLTEPF